nr:beta-ketoacyl reductase [Actinomycetota bacterium]
LVEGLAASMRARGEAVTVIELDAGDADLVDAATAVDRGVVIAKRLDLGKLRADARDDRLPPILRGIVRTRPRSGAAGRSLAARLAGVAEGEREALVLNLVQDELARVLGRPPGGAGDAERTFKDLGIDSISALQFRNGLQSATGLSLAATLAFDHPTALALARHLLERVEQSATGAVGSEIEHLERTLEAVAEPERARLAARLEALAAKLRNGSEDGVVADVAEASDEELFAIVDRKTEA